MTYKTRKRWALFILVVGLPAYIVLAVTVMNRLAATDWHWLIELMIYVFLGVVWIFPCRKIFLGIGQADPDKPN